MQQLSFDDLQQAEYLAAQPGRTAFIDESGNFGFDFSKEGTSKHYLVSAVIVKNDDIQDLEASVEDIRKSNFGSNGEMKSSKVGTDDRRRIKILNELIQLDFTIVLLIADKERFYRDSALANYKDSFIKYLRNLLYQNLYVAYPKLHIVEDKMGWTEFQESFKRYVVGKRTEFNFFDEYSFDFVDSRDSVLVQLSDFVIGSVARQLTGVTTPNYQNILRGKILHIERFPGDTLVNLNPNADNSKFNEQIASLAIRRAAAFIKGNESSEEAEKRLQVIFLKYLLNEVKYDNPYRFITSKEILSFLGSTTDYEVTRDYIFRRIVAPLRDAKVILATCAQGYKLPISSDDLTSYLNQTKTVISPMLHRMGICREIVLQDTDGALDILDDNEFIRFKKYFD